MTRALASRATTERVALQGVGSGARTCTVQLQSSIADEGSDEGGGSVDIADEGSDEGGGSIDALEIDLRSPRC